MSEKKAQQMILDIFGMARKAILLEHADPENPLET